MDIDKKKIEALLKNPTVTDEKLRGLIRENARERIANRLILLVWTLYIAFLISGSILIFFQRIEFRDLLELILALGMLAGFLGTAIHFYFKE